MRKDDEKNKIRNQPSVYVKLYSRAMEKAQKQLMRKPNSDFLKKGKGAAHKGSFAREAKEHEDIVIAIPLKAGKMPVSRFAVL